MTNAHVVWPFDEVRVVFPNGADFTAAPVKSIDVLGDLAVIGPIDFSDPGKLQTPDLPRPVSISPSLRVTPSPVVFTNGEDLAVGSDLFLIGYPAESLPFPQPAISGGVLSRFREWEALEITYFQTATAIAGGQSGGVLVSSVGEVIGISGLVFSTEEARFGLVASAADVMPRVEGLIAGDDVSGLGARPVPTQGGGLAHNLSLANAWELGTYVINVPARTHIEVAVESANNAAMSLFDVNSIRWLAIDENIAGVESGSVRTDLSVPYFLSVGQTSEASGNFRISSNRHLIPYLDPDDGKTIGMDETVVAAMDFPGDVDYFLIDLKAGETIEINADSLNIDTLVRVHYPRAKEIVLDDDSGGGLFGNNAKVVYRAVRDDKFFVVVGAARFGTGGYLLTVSQAAPDALLTPATHVEPSPTDDYNLSTMLPNLNDLPAGLSIGSEGFVEDTDALAEYGREFKAGDPVAQLGMSLVTSLTTSVELQESEAEAKFFVSLLNGLDPQVIGEALVKRMAEENLSQSAILVSSGSVDVSELGDAAGLVFRIESAERNLDFYWVVFSRGPLNVLVMVAGPQVTSVDTISIAKLIIERIDNSPPRMTIRGAVIADANPSKTAIDQILFTLTNPGGSAGPVNLSESSTTVTYLDDNQAIDCIAINWSLSPLRGLSEAGCTWSTKWVIGSGVDVDPGEEVALKVTLTQLRPLLGKNTEFTIPINSPGSAPVIFNRTTPTELRTIMNLQGHAVVPPPASIPTSTPSLSETQAPPSLLPTPTPTRTYMIAFASLEDGNYHIHISDANGQNVRQLTFGNSWDWPHDWSPDGEQIAYTKWSQTDGVWDAAIFTISADGSGQQALIDDPESRDQWPRWSPDGEQIVYVSDRDGNREVYLANADGTNRRRMTNNTFDDIRPDWSPNGRYLAYSSDRDDGRQIYLFELRTGVERAMTSGDPNKRHPVFSPDGRWLAYQGFEGPPNSNDSSPVSEIYLFDLEAEQTFLVTTEEQSACCVEWSPDSAYLYFQFDIPGLDRSAIFKTSLNGGTPELVLRGHRLVQLVVSPNLEQPK